MATSNISSMPSSTARQTASLRFFSSLSSGSNCPYSSLQDILCMELSSFASKGGAARIVLKVDSTGSSSLSLSASSLTSVDAGKTASTFSVSPHASFPNLWWFSPVARKCDSSMLLHRNLRTQSRLRGNSNVAVCTSIGPRDTVFAV